MNLVIGASGIPAEAVAAWSRSSIPEVRKRCFARLDRSMNDAQIAAEVLAAYKAGSQDFLKEYVDARLSVGEPASTARALLLVCGFSDVNDHASATHQRFEVALGLSATLIKRRHMLIAGTNGRATGTVR